MGVEMEGFDELQDDLEEMKNKAEELDGENQVEFGEIFHDDFMNKYTDFGDVDSFFEATPWNPETEEEFDAIPEDELDEFVQENSKFKSWEEILGKATEEWTAEQLGFD